jgi:3-oxoacyl-[acyl-carrier protein] reductase
MESTLPLSQKTAVITGASRGVGASIAYELAKRGADVVLVYASPKSEPLIKDLKKKIESHPHTPNVLSIRTDLASIETPNQMVNDVVSWRGAKEATSVDILVNNAGTELVKKLQDITVDDFEVVYNLNFRAPLLLTQALLPYMPPSSRIINIGSVGARAGFASLSLYCSSKAALEGLTRSWAAELGENGTTVNCVNPGPVQSEMLDDIPKDIVEAQKKGTPVENRLGTKEEVADVVAWLAGPDSRWVTGQSLSVSGGWAMY